MCKNSTQRRKGREGREVDTLNNKSFGVIESLINRHN